MELWISHLFPDLNATEATLLSRILYEKQLRLTTEELKTILPRMTEVNGTAAFLCLAKTAIRCST